MYTDAPDLDLELDTFEAFALDRLEVLKSIDGMTTRGMRGEELNAALSRVLDSKLAMLRPEDRVKDEASHLILRLAYSRTEELKRWFISQETILFRHRFETEGRDGVAAFMRRERVEYDLVSDEELGEVEPQLAAVHRATAPAAQQGILPVPYYKIPFQQALSLIARRRVFLRRGFAYVPREQMVSIMAERFRAALTHAMAAASRALPAALQDQRIAPLLWHMSKQGEGNQYSVRRSSVGQVSLRDIDALAKESFPLCMRHMHGKLRETHHLRYEGRAQYGLFLKGIGLSLEDAMVFWKTEFTKVKSPEQFDKEYSYNIRHLYGKEGKRTDYNPRSCVRIITGAPPGSSDHHGCPFRHFDASIVGARLRNMGLPADKIDAMLKLVKDGDYQLACKLHWDASHPGGDGDGVGNHPNAWFDASRKYYADLKAGESNTSGPDAAAQPTTAIVTSSTGSGESGEGAGERASDSHAKSAAGRSGMDVESDGE